MLDIWIHTVLRRAVADTHHKEERPQKVMAERAGCWQSALLKHIHGRKRKRCTSSSDGCSLVRAVKQSRFKKLGELYKECMKSHWRVQEIGYKSLISGVKPLLNLLLLVLCVLSSPESTNPNVYQEILERFMLPSAGEIYVDADFLLACDSSPQRICGLLSRGGWETADLTIQMS